MTATALTPPAATLRAGGFADLVAAIGEGAAERDREDVNPFEPIARLRAARLGAVTLPHDGTPPATMRELLGLVIDLAEADPVVAHILRAHFWQVREILRLPDGPAKRVLLEAVRAGQFVGNASSEAGNTAGTPIEQADTVASVIVPASRAGIEVLDDWDGMGQSRTPAAVPFAQ